MKLINKFALAALATIAFAAPALAQGPAVFGGAIGGLVIVDGAGSFGATFAEGFQELGGQSFGKTEITAGAASNFSIGLGGVSANLAGFTTSNSVSGSLVNGTGSAWNTTGGIAFSGAGLGGAIGGIGF